MNLADTRVCPSCGEEKPLDAFHLHVGRTNRRSAYCKPCGVSRNRDYRYGLPRGGFAAMVAAQEGRCAICGDHVPEGEWHVDHDHACCPDRAKSCGKCIRGLLCRGCNHAIGNLRDDPNLALAAAAYLLEYQGGESDQSR